MMRTSYFCWKDKANRHILLRKYLQRRDKEYYLGRVFNCIYTAYKENSIKRLLNSKVKSVKERLRKKAGLRRLRMHLNHARECGRRVSSIQSMTAKYCANRAFEKWIHHTRLTLKAKHAQLVIVKNRDFRLTGNVFRLWKRKGYLQRALNQFCRYRASEYICRDYWQRWRQSLREGMHHTTQSQKADLHYNGRVKKIVFQRMTQIHSEWQCKNHVLLEKGRDFRIFWKLRHSFPKWKAHFNARRYQKKCTQKAVELWRLLAKARYVREWKSFTVRRAFLSNKLDEVKERQRARVLKRHFVVWDARLFRRKKEMHDKMEACKQIQHQQYIKTGRLKRALQSWNSAYKKRIREHCLDKRARNHFAHNSNKNVFSRWIHLARQRKESKRLDEQAQEFSRVWVLRMSVGQWQASLDKSRIRLHQLVAALSKWKDSIQKLAWGRWVCSSKMKRRFQDKLDQAEAFRCQEIGTKMLRNWVMNSSTVLSQRTRMAKDYQRRAVGGMNNATFDFTLKLATRWRRRAIERGIRRRQVRFDIGSRNDDDDEHEDEQDMMRDNVFSPYTYHHPHLFSHPPPEIESSVNSKRNRLGSLSTAKDLEALEIRLKRTGQRSRVSPRPLPSFISSRTSTHAS
mmetsp:Transcript_32510/g.52681  ORF Transcript_32510/g.52681 Transcript_32510/m.52681 type:complete len:626 (+) Transcript_32510:3-1880(+)